jgi:hypothetical protein
MEPTARDELGIERGLLGFSAAGHDRILDICWTSTVELSH